MRTLLAHSLRLLIVACVALFGLSLPLDADLPRPIGQLSDYGAVFDRHDRDEIHGLLEDVRTRLGLEVYILISWESPYPTVREYADAVFGAWGLGGKNALLLVFLRAAGDWSASAVMSPSARTRLGPLDRTVIERTADLVLHDRIEEATRLVLSELQDLPSAQQPAQTQPGAGVSSAAKASPLVVILPTVGGVLILAWVVSRRVCPRCGRWLRVQPVRFRSARSRRVYSCRRCGYRR
ncbi:MAG: TPM domain-containing protein [Candidatus Bipolaricaulota bacterium]